MAHIPYWYSNTSTPQLPFKEPQIPSNRDHKALNRGTLGGLGIDMVYGPRHMVHSVLKDYGNREPLSSPVPAAGSGVTQELRRADGDRDSAEAVEGHVFPTPPMYPQLGHIVSVRGYLECLRV